MLWQDSEYFFDIVDKAHIEHPVCLIQDQAFYAGEVQGFLAHMIQKASRGGDYDIDPFAQCRDLWVNAYAAKNNG